MKTIDQIDQKIKQSYQKMLSLPLHKKKNWLPEINKLLDQRLEAAKVQKPV